jgi:MYXO-CTERM domain-containing protein
VNDPPTFLPVATVTVPRNSGEYTLALEGFGPGGGPDEAGQTVTLTATSSNPAVVPDPVQKSPGAGTLVFTPVKDQKGTATITLTAKDDGGTANGGNDTFVSSFTVVVSATNTPPQASDGTVVSDGHPVAVTLKGQDLDPGDQLTFTVTEPTSHGTLTGDAPNLTYTPAADFSGLDTLTFTVSDGTATSAPATFTIDVVRPAAPASSRYAFSCGCSAGEGVPVEIVPLGLALLGLARRWRRSAG